MKLTKKVLSGLMIVASLGLVLAGCASKNSKTSTESDLAAIKKDGTVTIGLEGTFPPYSYHDKDNKLTGFEVELGKNIAQDLGVKVKFVETKWDSLIAGLDANKYDIILNNVTINKEREAKFSFSTPYIYSHAVLAVKEGNTSITKPADLKGKKAAQSASSDYAQDATNLGATISSVDGFSQAISLVTEGRADGTINDDITFYTYEKTQKEAGKATGIQLVDGNISTNKVGALMRKDDTKLTKAVSDYLAKAQKDGSLAKLSVKYFGQDMTKE